MAGTGCETRMGGSRAERCERRAVAAAAARPYVFVIMPFDQDYTDEYELGVKPACEAAGATCARVDEQIFLERIYGQIAAADIIVAEMTDRNPNVFYETGYAHGLARPVILLTKTADDIPSDLRHYPHIVHEGSIALLRRRLEEHVRWFIENPEEAKATLRRHADPEREECERMALHIVNYLNANDFSKVSFERIRANINPGYSDEKLARLIDISPTQFRRVRMSRDRPGIGLVKAPG
jgi:nucleoside 2-deoxyribosyltransferase